MNIVQVWKIHADPAFIYTIGGKLDHVTYIIAATHNFSYFILHYVFCITALMTISYDHFLLRPLKIETN